MAREMSVSDTVTVAADPMAIWTAIADPSQMPRWSPENTGADVPVVGTPLAVGDSFVGSNKRGRARWHTRCFVTASTPGEEFTFDVREIGVRRPLVKGAIARWSYTLETVDAGTRVTETWHDGRRSWPDGLATVFDKIATGGDRFADFQRRNISRTLAAIKADFEQSGSTRA